MKTLLCAVLCALFLSTGAVAAFWLHGSSYSGPPPVVTGCGTAQPSTAQARADIAAMGYTCNVFYDNFTSLSTIDLTQNAPPYSSGFNWYSVPGWPRVPDCNATSSASDGGAWCKSPAQNVSSGFATLTGGKVTFTQNVSIPSTAYPILMSCYQIGSPPYYAGFVIPQGGFYLESKFASGTPTIMWVWSADYLTAGANANSQWTELDNVDNGGNGRGAVAWYTTGGAQAVNEGGFLVADNTNTTALIAGVLAIPSQDNTGQTLSSGTMTPNVPVMNWYNTAGFNGTQQQGNGAAWPSGDNWIQQITGHGSFPQHNCLLISANGVGTTFGMDWVGVWTKPPATTVAFTSIAPTSGSFTAGTSTPFMTVAATLSSGSFSGTWSIKTSGTDQAGTTCNNYGTNITINSGTGVLTNSASAPVQAYPGLCVTATQAGVSNSPYTQALSVTGTGTGALITSYTIQNGDPANAVVPGSTGYPIIFGQSWARGDLPTTGSPMYPICKDHSNGAMLTCQFDQIATHRENGDDNSWRHASFSVLLPAASPQYVSGGLAACTSSPCSGTFQVDFVSQAGTYSPVVQGSINDVCNGHDIKLVMTDVRNQDDTLRGPTGATGTLTFDTCVAKGNTGRDAPRQFAQGAVRNGWLIQGPPVYSNGAKDPLLYVKCYMSQTYTLSGTLGPLQHDCSVHHAWMNVTAGSAGNSGAPGPVGFTNDPQAISYRPVLYDGATAILDWGTSYFDETVADTALTVATGVWAIPGLGANTTSQKAWSQGMAFRYSDSGTPPTATQGTTGGPFGQNQLMSVCPAYSCGNEATYNGQHQLFSKYAAFNTHNLGIAAPPHYTARGTGNSTFSWRLVHYWETAWATRDPTGFENWSAAGSTTRYVSYIQPQFTTAQRTYWSQTGTMPPLLIQPVSNFPSFPPGTMPPFGNTRYAPLDLVGFQLGTGVGGRPDIGLQNEFVSEWWSAQTPVYWQFIKASAIVGMGAQQNGDMLNEVTARLPTDNNGPPAPNHGGGGTAYTNLGALFPNTRAFGGDLIASGVVAPLEGVPYNDCGSGNRCTDWSSAINQTLTDNTHQSAFALGVYQVSGGMVEIEALEAAANRAIYGWGTGCGNMASVYNVPTTGSGLGPCPIAGVNYYSPMGPGDERRGQAWALRDIGAAAYLGGDSYVGSERQYFNDVINETYWFNVACGLPCGIVDPPTPTSGIVLGGGDPLVSPLYAPTTGQNDIVGGLSSTFFDGYITQSMYLIWGLGHPAIAKDFLAQQYRVYSTVCADGTTSPPVANSPSSVFCGNYYYAHSVKTLSPSYTFNNTDGADYQLDNNGGGNYVTFAAGSQTITPTSLPTWGGFGGPQNLITEVPWTMKIKFYNWPVTSTTPHTNCSTLPDQITDGTWYYVVNNNTTTGTFQIATTPGSGSGGGLANLSSSQLGPFTVGATGYSGQPCNVMFRSDTTVTALGPTAGQFFNNPSYAMYSLAAVTGLLDINQSLGNIFPSTTAIRNNIITRFNDNTWGWTILNSLPNDCPANCQWDPAIVVK